MKDSEHALGVQPFFPKGALPLCVCVCARVRYRPSLLLRGVIDWLDIVPSDSVVCQGSELTRAGAPKGRR